jgi:hypothetical protein
LFLLTAIAGDCLPTAPVTAKERSTVNKRHSIKFDTQKIDDQSTVVLLEMVASRQVFPSSGC